ncbi:MAG: nucleotide pyrophosphohydrolase [Clostridia bacterium]|nr:nucleotide pyrophosphohydrolase [Clostridia bacterium]
MEKLVKEFNEKYMTPLTANIRLLDIQSELGELSKEVIKSQNYGNTKFLTNKDLELELGDLLYSTISFAIENNIDPKNCLNMAIEKYKIRFSKKGHIGSNQ